ncbi:hypothetical protein [Mesorhizobium abyssinicae]|uniref:hypothetical protein n=1 Tax=Mesorhizobium abyssinicae TaxID=1209958 RepID=UPI003390EF46
MVDRLMARAPNTNLGRNGETPAQLGESGKGRDAVSDPAIALFTNWQQAQRVSLVLCRLQQRLETRVLGAAPREATHEKVGYSIAYQAEVEAMTAALKLQDELPQTPARSLLGVVAKLEIIAGADRDIDDPTDFPWPHIASILDDLKEITGSLPLERPNRLAIDADCRRYRAMAADLVGLQTQTENLDLSLRPAVGIKPE